jgi:hypothetical protein
MVHFTNRGTMKIVVDPEIEPWDGRLLPDIHNEYGEWHQVGILII